MNYKLINLFFVSENVTTNVQTKIIFPKIKDEEVMVATSMRVDFSLAIMRVHLSNLFNGNVVLGRYLFLFIYSTLLQSSPTTEILNVSKILKKVLT